MNIKLNITKVKESNSGWIYCISSPTFRGLYKISSTKEPNIYEKISKGLNDNFKIEYAKYLPEFKKIENSIKQELVQYQSESNKKFFNLSIERVKYLFDTLEGEYYDDSIITEKKASNEEKVIIGKIVEHSGTTRNIEKMKFKIRTTEDGKIKDIWKYYDEVRDHSILIEYISKNPRINSIQNYEKSIKTTLKV
jgi:hypothetical protein